LNSEQQNRQVIYQLKITLAETDAPIWRRVRVPSGLTLHELHLIIQIIMGWTNSHLYRFQVGDEEFSEPDPNNDLYETPPRDSTVATLGHLVTMQQNTFLYEYDFGDDWRHDVLLEEVQEPETGESYPICVAGERACPPEDCGGASAYAELLSTISNPGHEDYADVLEWLGGSINPERLDLETVNKNLREMRIRS